MPATPGSRAFNPTSGSWLNLVEIFFGIITRQAIRRGTFTSVTDLIAAIQTYIDGWNERAHPFTWTKTANQILAKATPRKKTSNTRHYATTTFVSKEESAVGSSSAWDAPGFVANRDARCHRA